MESSIQSNVLKIVRIPKLRSVSIILLSNYSILVMIKRIVKNISLMLITPCPQIQTI